MLKTTAQKRVYELWKSHKEITELVSKLDKLDKEIIDEVKKLFKEYNTLNFKE